MFPQEILEILLDMNEFYIYQQKKWGFEKKVLNQLIADYETKYLKLSYHIYIYFILQKYIYFFFFYFNFSILYISKPTLRKFY